MAFDLSTTTGFKVTESGKKRNSARQNVWLLLIFSFFAGMATLALAHDLRPPDNYKWPPDLMVLLSSLVAVRFYAMRLMEITHGSHG